MKTIKPLVYIAAYLMVYASIWAMSVNVANAQDYTLKRTVITISDGSVIDSEASELSVQGVMNINGNLITQSATVCFQGICNERPKTTSEILHVADNEANVTIRTQGGLIYVMTIISLRPNIVTMVDFIDGTVEVDVWKPVK